MLGRFRKRKIKHAKGVLAADGERQGPHVWGYGSCSEQHGYAVLAPPEPAHDGVLRMIGDAAWQPRCRY
jgi:hypothetical protein